MDYEKLLEEHFITSKGISHDDYFNPKRPFIQNLDVMVRRIRNLINKGASFRIIGDYDVDGITASYIMKTGLLHAGAKVVTVRLPDRFTDGYGMKVHMAEETVEDVIITVDNGISAHDAIARAKELGKEVLVIDHHEPKVEDGNIVIPDADIIIDHKVYSGCNNDFCGAGLTLQVIEYLISGKPWVINRCYILAALATIADVVDVKNWNRKIIEHGIACINSNTDVPMGLKKVLEHQNMLVVDANSLAFRVCPVINAPGRMVEHGADISLALLEADTWDKANKLKDVVINLNIQRKEATEIGVENANRYIEKECLFGDIMPIFLEDIGEGILGIVAGRIAEKYKNTVGCFSKVIDTKNTELYKGSFRSNGINIKAVLDEIQKKTNSIYTYGGHEGAAGCSILAQNKIKFWQAFDDIDLSKYLTPVEETSDTIISVVVDDLEAFYKALEVYEPLGNGNRPPMVKVIGMELYPRQGALMSIMSKNTVKLFGKKFAAIGFGKYPDYQKAGEPKKLNLIGNIRKSYFGKNSEIQIEFESFEPIDIQNNETSLTKALRERMSML